MLNPINPFGLLIGREIALRQNVEPSRAVPLAMVGSLLGGAANNVWMGPLLTRHLAQREALSTAPSAPSASSGSSFASSTADSTELAEMLQLQDDLEAKIEASKENVKLAQKAVEAAQRALDEATKTQTEVALEAKKQAEEIRNRLEQTKQRQDASFDQAIASANEYVNKLSGVPASSAAAAGSEALVGAAGVARSAPRQQAKGNKVNLTPPGNR